MAQVRVVLGLTFVLIAGASAGWPQEAGDGSAPLALGDGTSQLVYTPVTPCRIFDTRGAGGSLAPGAARDFRVTGVGLQSQGGATAGCNVPVGRATAALINFIAVNPAGPGNLRVWAYSTPPEPPPGASIVNYTTVPGAILTLANGIALPICNPASTVCPFDLRIQADVNAVHVVGDVVGYFERFPTEDAGPPAGSILDYGGAAPPPGYLLCNGAEVSRTVYPRLFAAIGTAFGAGDGANTFRVPDFRGRFARGRDGGAGRDPEAGSRGASGPGGNVGDAVGSGQPDQFRGHVHGLGFSTGPGYLQCEKCGIGVRSFGDLTTQGSGGSETRPVNLYVNKIIRY
jgi:hypothetical protein